MATRTELGCAGHFVAAGSCRFRRHTQIDGEHGHYRVSTVGDYYHNGKRQTLGASEDSFFETYVFATTDDPDAGNEGCGCRALKGWCEIDGVRIATAGAAQASHESFVEKYMSLADAA
jgi:hypothetical protein